MTSMPIDSSKASDLTIEAGLLSGERVNAESYAAFCESFPLNESRIYQTIFERHGEIVQTQKSHIAVANLKRIFDATFSISEVSGFDRMSLRDLSRQTDMSMGAIYSCIRKKEDIALIIADVVRLSGDLTKQYAKQAQSNWESIEKSVRFHLFACTLLQPWYFFLYFETRSLPEAQRAASTQIELDAIAGFEAGIRRGVQVGEFATDNPRIVANNIVVLLEDWYLKPWKVRRPNLSIESQIEDYSQSVLALIKKLVAP